MEHCCLRSREAGRAGAVLPAVLIPRPVALVPLAPVTVEDLRGQGLELGQGVVAGPGWAVAAGQTAALAEEAVERVEGVGAGEEGELVVDGAVRVGDVVRRHHRALAETHHEGPGIMVQKPHRSAHCPSRNVGVKLVRSDGHVDVEASVGPELHRLADQVGAQVVVLLQGQGDGTPIRGHDHERGGVVVELVPVVEVRHQPKRDGRGQGQPRRQAAHPEHQVVGEDGEFLGRPVRFLRRPQVGALHRAVDDGPGFDPARHVRELGADVVAVAVQVTSGGAVDANAVARYQVTVGDVVAVEVDGTFVAGGQVEAQRVAAGQGLIGRTSGVGRRVGREILGEPRVLREVAVGGGSAGPRADQQKPRETADHVHVTHHITAECV